MKNSLISIIVFLLSSICTPAQTMISGTITDINNAPIHFASVYLSKTTVGVLTDMNGVYRLTITQEGKYELIASCLGYKTRSQVISADSIPQRINIKLAKYDIVLSEVIIKARDVNREQNYKLFIKNFIGETPNARLCTLENPKDAIIYLDYNDSILKALSRKPLIITNKALGYRIIYELSEFQLNLKTGHFRFSGNHYFQELKGSRIKQGIWLRNRSMAYYGSRMHFLRAIFNKSVTRESFEMHDCEMDSLTKEWIQAQVIDENEVYVGFNPGSVSLFHEDPIIILYYDNHPVLSTSYEWTKLKYKSAIIFSDSLHVYKNGYYPDTYGVSWGGHMAKDRIAEMLPFDFIPRFTESGKKDKGEESQEE